MAIGGRISHISDLGGFAPLVKTSGFERPPSEKDKDNPAAAAVAIAIAAVGERVSEGGREG